MRCELLLLQLVRVLLQLLLLLLPWRQRHALLSVGGTAQSPPVLGQRSQSRHKHKSNRSGTVGWPVSERARIISAKKKNAEPVRRACVPLASCFGAVATHHAHHVNALTASLLAAAAALC